MNTPNPAVDRIIETSEEALELREAARFYREQYIHMSNTHEYMLRSINEFLAAQNMISEENNELCGS